MNSNLSTEIMENSWVYECLIKDCKQGYHTHKNLRWESQDSSGTKPNMDTLGRCTNMAAQACLLLLRSISTCQHKFLQTGFSPYTILNISKNILGIKLFNQQALLLTSIIMAHYNHKSKIHLTLTNFHISKLVPTHHCCICCKHTLAGQGCKASNQSSREVFFACSLWMQVTCVGFMRYDHS